MIFSIIPNILYNEFLKLKTNKKNPKLKIDTKPNILIFTSD